jgi:hypothetical protein
MIMVMIMMMMMMTVHHHGWTAGGDGHLRLHAFVGGWSTRVHYDVSSSAMRQSSTLPSWCHLGLMRLVALLTRPFLCLCAAAFGACTRPFPGQGSNGRRYPMPVVLHP